MEWEYTSDGNTWSTFKIGIQFKIAVQLKIGVHLKIGVQLKILVPLKIRVHLDRSTVHLKIEGYGDGVGIWDTLKELVRIHKNIEV